MLSELRKDTAMSAERLNEDFAKAVLSQFNVTDESMIGR